MDDNVGLQVARTEPEMVIDMTCREKNTAQHKTY